MERGRHRWRGDHLHRRIGDPRLGNRWHERGLQSHRSDHRAGHQHQGVGLAGVTTRGIIIPAGIITTTIAVGSTTGRWLHYMRFKPLGLGIRVEPAF
jgi:hypothetical protein